MDNAGRTVQFLRGRRHGFIPTCDHGVLDNVPYGDYMHYRRRVMQLDH